MRLEEQNARWLAKLQQEASDPVALGRALLRESNPPSYAFAFGVACSNIGELLAEIQRRDRKIASLQDQLDRSEPR